MMEVFNVIDNNILSIFPGPEVIGEPFWCLMEWKNNRLTGNLFSLKGLCFFLRSQDAENMKKQFPNPHDWVVRGINKKFLNSIFKLYNENFKDVAPLLLVPPFLGGKKVLTIKMTTEELQYYSTHGKFIDEGFQKTIDYAFNIVNNPSPDMYTKRLSIDPFLNFLKDNYQKCARPYSNLPNIIEEYRSSIWEAAEHIEDEHEDLMKNMSPKDQCYTRTFMVDEKCSYDITWMVPRLEKAIKTYNLQPTTLPLKTLAPIVDQSNIVPNHLNKAIKNSEPILVVKYPLSNPALCIVDGNHRVIAKYKAGQTTIQAYLFEPQHHLEAMMYNVHRTLFKVHYNIYEISKYMSLENPTENIELLPLK